MSAVALRRVVALLACLLAALQMSVATAAAQEEPVDEVPVEWEDATWEEEAPEDAPEDWWEEEPAEAPVEEEPEWVEEPEPAEPPLPVIPVPTTRTIPGKVAYVRADGKAAIPRRAPKRVKRLIAAANEIVGKPYKWGGGHARLKDKGYDCSGTVGYALIRAGLLDTTMTSGQFARWGGRHPGRHITIYANKGHVYLEVAGLRLDTSAVADPQGGKGPRWRPVIGRRPGFKVRHPIGL